MHIVEWNVDLKPGKLNSFKEEFIEKQIEPILYKAQGFTNSFTGFNPSSNRLIWVMLWESEQTYCAFTSSYIITNGKSLYEFIKDYSDALPDVILFEVVTPLDRAKEEKRLKRWFWGVFGILATVCSICIGLTLWFLFPQDDPYYRAAIICVAVATLGSSAAALLSANDRQSNGWEFSDGIKSPVGGKKDRFSLRMVPFFLCRPFLGATVGIALFLGVMGGIVVKVTLPDSPSERLPFLATLAFIAFLGGLFAKTLLEQLKNLFNYLLGKKYEQDITG